MREIRFGKDRFHQNREMFEWLICRYGEGGWHKQSLEDGKRWAAESAFGNTRYYFKDDRDATMFLLRWA